MSMLGEWKLLLDYGGEETEGQGFYGIKNQNEEQMLGKAFLYFMRFLIRLDMSHDAVSVAGKVRR